MTADWRRWQAAGQLLAGVDEVGRGPLAGVVVAAAVILDPERPIPGLRDSKLVSARQRPLLAAQVREQALGWALGRASVAEIDELNILQASLLAMRRAVEALQLVPARVLIDGNRCPPLAMPALAVVGGDRLVPAISAASVLAKVTRDEEMELLEQRYPGYGFAAHKGYPTPQHLAALSRLGACAIHRRSFAPVRAVVAQCRLELD